MSQPTSTQRTSLEERVAVLEAREAARDTRRRRARRWLGGGALALLAVSPLALAADGNCPNGYPFCFSADAPARAVEVNHNFSQVKEWLETKVGPVGSAAVNASGATINGAATVTGNTSVGGSLTVSGTTTLGGELQLGPTARARIRSTAWCDCEYGSETVDRSGNLLSGSVADNFLFENGQAATFQCRGGRFLVGIEKVSAACLSSVGCLEQYKCCRPCNFQRE